MPPCHFAPKLPLWLVLAMLPMRTWSACGLGACPRQESKIHQWEAGVFSKQVGYQLGGNEGTYSEISAEIQFMPSPRWLFAAMMPWIALDLPAENRIGAGNPMALAEFRFASGRSKSGLGLQLELPLGDDAGGLAGHHFVLIPYASWSRDFALFFLNASAGGSFAVFAKEDPHSGHPGHILYVNPHEERELLYRLAPGIRLWNRKASPELSLSGQVVLSENKMHVDGTHFLEMGIAFPMQLGRLLLAPNAELPLTRPHRMDWSLGLATKFNL